MVLAPVDGSPADALRRVLGTPVSGSDFQAPSTRALQQDAFANPGLLWVDRGRALWSAPPSADAKACADCHGRDGSELKGAAARYPSFDSALQKLVNLEQRINACRTGQQGVASLAYESEALLSITTFVANLSRDMPVAVEVGPSVRARFEAGRDYYYRRRGQLNLACNHCHELNWGRQLRGDRISQGHGNGYPTYRLEWQSVGSLHRRFRACNLAIRAEPLPYGAPDYVNLELFLAWRARGLQIETPAVRH